MQRRYWVTVNAETELLEDSEEKLIDSEFNRFCEKVLGVEPDETEVGKYQFLLKEWMESEEVEKLQKEIDDKVNELGLDPPDIYCCQVTAQPQCPECGEVKRFADSYCSGCGEALI